ncbi:MAG TPA: enoyl-CoA hydratase-related protein [Panacibacter sp.]|nr:enoyl-CoA hydratase-related protein [Panacibacter sp.]
MPSILFEIKDGVGIIKFNRPDKMNAMNREMALLLKATLDKCGELPEVRCVYITGSGNSFCSGQDLSEVDTGGASSNQILRELYTPLVWKIRSIHKPVVAAINAVAAGAGANLAFCCDVVLATESAYFMQAFSKIGLVPDTGGTYILPRFVGWQRASALMMLADKISAAEGERMGMIYKYFPDEKFEEEAMKIARKLAEMPTRSLTFIKHALNYSSINSFEEQLAIEDEFQQEALQTHDYKEGVKAFLEKRKPHFTGE